MTEQRIEAHPVLAVVLAAGFSLVSGWAVADVYKTVDEDGNVTYTDQPPAPGAEPMQLKELSVVERPEYQAVTPRTASQDDDRSSRDELRELQRDYRDFRLVTPSPEQNFWGTANTAQVVWDTSAALSEGLQVRIYIDDEAVTTTTQSMYTTPPLDRGEHTVRADLLDGDGNVLAQAGPVTFYIHQQTVNNNPNRPQPAPHRR